MPPPIELTLVRFMLVWAFVEVVALCRLCSSEGFLSLTMVLISLRRLCTRFILFLSSPNR